MRNPAQADAVPIAVMLAAATRRLAQVSDSPRHDAELLLEHASGLTRAQLLSRDDAPLAPAAGEKFLALVERRATGVPIAHLTGQAEFWSLPLAITGDVLVPRPSTERLVELALELIAADRPVTVLDLGTGSGAIALAIAHERPLALITAVDRSESALAVAAQNAALLAPQRIELIASDWFGGLAGRRFEAIVANPPYVATADPDLDPHVARHEPAAALYAGADGLDALDTLIAAAPVHLEPAGWLLVEHGARQAADVRARFAQHGYDAVRTEQDLERHDRVTLGRLP
jgi:release factor glutamine methyltransferase